jgi:hypothetical protein
MTALELIAQLADLVARHGDHQILFEGDNIPTILESVTIFKDEATDSPPFYLMLPPSMEQSEPVIASASEQTSLK